MIAFEENSREDGCVTLSVQALAIEKSYLDGLLFVSIEQPSAATLSFE